jgi:hypothetical protein
MDLGNPDQITVAHIRRLADGASIPPFATKKAFPKE